MKIISLGPAHPYRGGLASFSNRLAVQFKSEGHEVEMITFSLQYPRFLFPGRTQYTDSPPPEGIRITRMLNSVNPFSWLSTGLRIKKERPDILLLRFWLPFMGPSLGSVARIVRRNRHTVVICIFDNVVPHEKRPGDRLLTKYLTGSVDGAIVMSDTVLYDLGKFARNIVIRLNPHPLFDNYGEPLTREDALEKLNLPIEPGYLLFFGFIRAYKGLDLLIEAFADPRFSDMNLRLIVAGEFYEDDTRYRDLIKKFNLEEKILLFDHFIRDSEVPWFFSAADLVVQPYRTATQSGVTQIAYHFGKPMLVTDAGGLREIVADGRCGYVVKPGPAEISDAIFDYFSRGRKEEFTRGVIEEKQKFSWDKMTATIVDLYNTIRGS